MRSPTESESGTLWRAYYEAQARGEPVDFERLCREHPEHADELRALRRAEELLKVGLPKDSDPSALPAELDAALRKLRSRGPVASRYTIRGELGRGGMGVVFEAFDEDLRRTVALKIIREDVSAATLRDPRHLARFLEEAQVTGQLEHPSIVPVYELGIDEHNRVYYTMQLVEGETLARAYEHVHARTSGWTLERALGVLLRVCEAVAFAHSREVLHRDLKPLNVMVGTFGQVYVMDWGLARALGHAEPPKDASPEAPRPVDTLREKLAEESPEFYTQPGGRAGTPSYMAPELTKGMQEDRDGLADMYALGAMLYELLAGHPPYKRVKSTTGDEILRKLAIGPPEPLGREVPAELVAICEQAMARDHAQRYPSAKALAADLTAYLEGRVVAAHEAGTWAETKKWIRRNKPLASSLASALILLVLGLTASLALKARADENAVLATQQSNDVLSLSAIQYLGALENRSQFLWPPVPELVPTYEEWIADARILIEGRASDLQRGIKAFPSLAQHKAKLAELTAPPLLLGVDTVDSARGGGPRYRDFDAIETQWWRSQLEHLVLDLESFIDSDRGGLYSSGLSDVHGWGVLRRNEFAKTIATRSINGLEAQRRWRTAIAAIEASPLYRGLALVPQLGLLPIGENATSHLWEFWHIATGDEPAWDHECGAASSSTSGLTLVLIPGGDFEMGATEDDLDAKFNEKPRHLVTLSPFLVSKYEMTQGQWMRLTGSNPSFYQPGKHDFIRGLNHPVEAVSWRTVSEVLGRVDLELPTEAQWEFAARGGTRTRWWTGDQKGSLFSARAANLADGGSRWGQRMDAPNYWDGYDVHSEVDGLTPNRFGLFGVHGNIGEWCADGADDFYYRKSQRFDPVQAPSYSRYRAVRGGWFWCTAREVRSSQRIYFLEDSVNDYIGVRPMRPLR